MAEVVKAPEAYNVGSRFTIFLAGSIDMGEAEDWRSKVAERLKDYDNVLLLNPRRDDWDSSWKQEIQDPQFSEQVRWELQGQEDADLVIFFFSDGSKSPITLLELGLGLGRGIPAMVYCSDFYRKGNVDVSCDFYDVPVFEDEEEFMSALETLVQEGE